MTGPNSATAEKPFTIDTFAEFWAAPKLDPGDNNLAEDVVGYWPGRYGTVSGIEEYVGILAKLLDAVPDLTLAVAEHAESGEYIFVRWIASGTGRGGSFEFTGIDRIKVVDGKVKENYIRFDIAEFEEATGVSLSA
ncbi:MAG: hypothetical protein QOJ43_798 [Gaiellaceae bacterium]|jgi:hypothetical protein|nr:hypothetical protein [Gaiellaceae bacterium]